MYIYTSCIIMHVCICLYNMYTCACICVHMQHYSLSTSYVIRTLLLFKNVYTCDVCVCMCAHTHACEHVPPCMCMCVCIHT